MTKEEYINYRCPRWEDFPEVELYADQVISIMVKYFSCFFEKGQMPITQSMINNYVKQKIVKPPIKKKYDRVHLSYLAVVCLLKRFLSLSQICDGMAMILEDSTVEEAYNSFCDQLEACLKDTFSGRETKDSPKDDKERIVKSVTKAFANICLAEELIKERGTKADKPY